MMNKFYILSFIFLSYFYIFTSDDFHEYLSDSCNSDTSFKNMIQDHIVFSCTRKRKKLDPSSVNPILSDNLFFNKSTLSDSLIQNESLHTKSKLSKIDANCDSQFKSTTFVDWQKLIKNGSNKQLKKYLLCLPQDVIVTNKFGENPVHIAVKTSGAEEALKIILQIRPDWINHKDHKGKLPEDYLTKIYSKENNKLKMTAKSHYIQIARKVIN